MDANVNQPSKARRLYFFAAWASLLAAVVISLVLWWLVENHQGTRGERPLGVLRFYLVLLVASVIGDLAAMVSLFGIRSWRSALIIVPGAVLSLCLNSANAVMCYYAYALAGVNLGG